MNKKSTPGYLNATERNAALEGFVADEAQLLRLYAIARRRAGSDLEAEELVQEAFRRILDEDRSWPRGVATQPFIVKVIQSIASEIREKRKRRRPHMHVIGDPPDDTVPCLAPTAAEALEALQHDMTMRARAFKYFEDDPELLMLTEALLEGWKKQDLLSLFDNDELRYQTTRKRFRRRMTKLQAAPTKIGGPHDQDHARENDNS